MDSVTVASAIKAAEDFLDTATALAEKFYVPLGERSEMSNKIIHAAVTGNRKDRDELFSWLNKVGV